MPINEISKQVFNQHPVVLIGIHSGREKGIVRARFAELDRFKRESDASAVSFNVHKKSAFTYRFIFLMLGFLFLSLMGITCAQNTSWFCSLYFTNCALAKSVLASTSGLLGVASIMIAMCIRAEKEAVIHLLKKFKRKLAIVYHYRCHEIGWKRFLRIFQGCTQTAGMRRAYREAVDRLNEVCENTLYLMMHIARSRELDKSNRERLFDQALLEMDEKLERVLRNLYSNKR